MALAAKLLAYALVAGAALLPTPLLAATYYVAPTGSDANAGTLGAPFATISRAQTAASSGDTVYLRGGTYQPSNTDITSTDANYAYVNNLTKGGITYIAYPGETPVFNFSNVRPTDLRVCAFLLKGGNITLQGFEITGVQITIATVHTQSECIRIESDHNTLRLLKLHDGMGIGVYIVKHSGNNLVENCDAYNNTGLDGGSIGNIDGFGCHVSAGSTGNVFRGCRAWANSDDGYDTINCSEPVTFDHCWAMDSGWQGGDGNGFKVGGWGSTPAASLPNPIPRHTVMFCLSVHNKASGFYANHQPGGSAYWYNNTAYNNRDDFNMLERTSDNVTDIPGVNEIMHNNLGYKATRSEVNNLNQTDSSVSNNFWNSGVTVNDSDFISQVTSQFTQPRQADGSLPVITFLHLMNNSDLIDKGINIGQPFLGSAPDLGCFENVPLLAPANLTAAAGNTSVTLTWDAATAADGYIVKRSATSSGSYTAITGNIASLNYTDTGRTNGVAYYYVVASANSGGVSGNSTEVSAVPAESFAERAAGAFPGESSQAVIGPDADPDGDGYPNIVEYAFGTSLATPNPGGLDAVTPNGANTLVFTFPLSKNVRGISYTVEKSVDLVNWVDTNIPATVQADMGAYYLMQAAIPRGSDALLFLRLRVTLAE